MMVESSHFKPAQESSILQDLIEVVHVTRCVEVLASDDFDPFQTFLGKLFTVLAIDLHTKK